MGRDVRLSGAFLPKALVNGLQESGAEVVNLGEVGTEMIYFAVPYMNMDGGIMITASHNPREYNGMKFVSREAEPLTDELFNSLGRQVLEEDYPDAEKEGSLRDVDILSDYVEAMLAYVDLRKH